MSDKKIGITYALSGGRLGDNLIAYLHARWVAITYDLPFVFKEFPYANSDAVSPPKRERAHGLCALRPDLPAWLDAALARAIAHDPNERFDNMESFALELEAGPPRHGPVTLRQRTFYERSPVLFWQIVASLLAFGLVLSFLRH